MGDCVSPADVSDFASKDTNRIVGTVAVALAANAVFLNVLEGGVYNSGVSDEVRSVVQLPAAPGDSLAEPTFVNDTDVCGTVGTEDRVSTTEFSYRLKTLRSRGPRICVKNGYSAFRDSYTRAEQSLADVVTQKINADVRAQLFRNSASKFNAAAGYNFSDLFTGGTPQDVGVDFAQVEPSGQLSFKALHRVARHLREALFAKPFSLPGVGQHFKFIGSSEVIEGFREETGVKDVLLSLVSGQYQLGEKVLTGYAWDAAAPYRGLTFGIDQRPLRAAGFNVDGDLTFINPILVVEDDVDANTAHAEINPDWAAAPFEVGFLLAMGTLERQVPEKYIGEGMFKFAPQLHMGELMWHYVIDNDCNQFGDFGWHIYQITRAYRPVRPEHIVPILYRRCEADLGLDACASSGAELTGGVL
jgi:hypothetical protein